MKALSLALGLVATFFGAHAAAQSRPTALDGEARRWLPTLALEAGFLDEELRFEGASDERSLWFSRLSIGVAVGLPSARLRGSLRSVTELGLGLVYRTGHWPLSLRQGVHYERRIAERFALVTGLDVALQLDARAPRRSHAEMGLNVGFRAGPFELAWRPHLAFRLGEERTQVFEGTRVRRIATQLQLFHLVARFHFRTLGS
ncbi:MAG: hypothetical protein H6722_11525 [Sandaracinus sp.]|nr:hypothetical protein [Sandaracinus sp.]